MRNGLDRAEEVGYDRSVGSGDDVTGFLIVRMGLGDLEGPPANSPAPDLGLPDYGLPPRGGRAGSPGSGSTSIPRRIQLPAAPFQSAWHPRGMLA